MSWILPTPLLLLAGVVALLPVQRHNTPLVTLTWRDSDETPTLATTPVAELVEAGAV